MDTPVLKTSDCRSLVIDFELHTDGDMEFKKELIELMVENLRELQAADQRNDHAFFTKTCHKIKATISIINDHELTAAIAHLSAHSPTDEAKRPEWARVLNEVCGQIITSLLKEAA